MPTLLNLQKAVYFLQELFGLDTGCSFILYKHGPFSFDLRDELTSLRADGLLVLEPQAPPYGPRFAATELAQHVQQSSRETLATRERQLDFVAAVVDSRTVGELERLATALFVTTRMKKEHNGTTESRAEYLCQLKPHVPRDAAREAVLEVDELLETLKGGTIPTADVPRARAQSV